MTDAGTDGDFVGMDVGSAPAVLAAVGQLAMASEQASLVRLGLSSGLLAHCTKSVTVTDLATAINAPQTAVAAVCDALIALGALQREGNEVRLSPAWAPLAQDGLDVMLERNLDGAVTRQCLIEEALSEPTTYWELGFDLVFWSQFFFRRDTRQATLENAFARLRPGGLLICPVLGGDGESPETGSQAAQQASLDAIICGRSDIPVLSCDDLAKEVTAAGFADAQEHRGDVTTVVIARRAAS